MPKETNKKQSNQNKEKKEKKHFIKDFKAELKRVIWPTPKQLLNNTTAVITIVLITAIIVFALDFAFERLNQYGVERVKTIVESRNTVENTVEDTAENAVDNTAENVVENEQTSENHIDE